MGIILLPVSILRKFRRNIILHISYIQSFFVLSCIPLQNNPRIGTNIRIVRAISIKSQKIPMIFGLHTLMIISARLHSIRQRFLKLNSNLLLNYVLILASPQVLDLRYSMMILPPESWSFERLSNKRKNRDLHTKIKSGFAANQSLSFSFF